MPGSYPRMIGICRRALRALGRPLVVGAAGCLLSWATLVGAVYLLALGVRQACGGIAPVVLGAGHVC